MVDSRPALRLVPQETSEKNFDDRLKKVLAYRNILVVERIRSKLNLSEPKAKDLFTELMKFLYLRSRYRRIVASPIIEAAWEFFILSTEEYGGFCRRNFGGFIHHEPRLTLASPEEIQVTHEKFIEHFKVLNKYWEFNRIYF